MKSDMEEYLIKYNKYILIIIGIILIGITIYAVGAQEMITAQITKTQTGLTNGSWINLSNPVNATSGILEFEIRPETWTKKRALHINNTAGSESNYTSVNLTVPYINGMNNDFSDLRFYNDTDGTIQPYWIESKVNGSWAKVWINISHLNADSWTNNTYYMYYSNPSATYNNSLGGTNTFIQWHGQTTEQFVDSAVQPQPFVSEYKARVTSTSFDVRWGTTVPGGSPFTNQGSITIEAYSPGGSTWFIIYNNGAAIHYPSSAMSWTVNQWYRLKIIASNTQICAYRDNIIIGSCYSGSPFTAKNMGLFQTAGTKEQEFSFIRKYASPEPSIFISNEEIEFFF